MRDVLLRDAVTTAIEAWAHLIAAGELAHTTSEAYQRQVRSFGSFASAQGLRWLSEVDSPLCFSWIHAPVSSRSPGSRGRVGQQAAVATRRGRQIVLRRAVRFWISQGLLSVDPVPTEVLRPEPSGLCPLIPVEVAQLRLSGRTSPGDWLRPAMVEATLAGASQRELALLTVAVFDPTAGTLLLPGNRNTGQRFAPLGPAAVTVLSARVRDLERSAKRGRQRFDPTSAPLTMHKPLESYRSQSLAPSVAANLRRALQAAGVTRVGVRPSSILQFAANATYARTGRVEDVAALLGLGSLDRARAQIDPAWQAKWAEQVRAQGDG